MRHTRLQREGSGCRPEECGHPGTRRGASAAAGSPAGAVRPEGRRHLRHREPLGEWHGGGAL